MARIIKAENSNVQGGFKIALNTPTNNINQRPAGTASKEAACGAVITQVTDQYAIIEVTCACGNKNLIRCEF